MGPFDLPPSTPPVSFEPPQHHGRGRRARGRTAVLVGASVALIGAGVLAIAQFASNDDSSVANAAQEAGTTPPTPAPVTAPPTVAPNTAPATTAPAGDTSGKIVIRIGDGDPIVIDLGDLGALAAGGGLGDFGNIEQCIGDLPFDIDLNGGAGGFWLPRFDRFRHRGTRTGPRPHRGS